MIGIYSAPYIAVGACCEPTVVCRTVGIGRAGGSKYMRLEMTQLDRRTPLAGRACLGWSIQRARRTSELLLWRFKVQLAGEPS